MHTESAILSETVRLTRKLWLVLVAAAVLSVGRRTLLPQVAVFSDTQPPIDGFLLNLVLDDLVHSVIWALIIAWPAYLIYADSLRIDEAGRDHRRIPGLALRYFVILWIANLPYYISLGATYWSYPDESPVDAPAVLEVTLVVAVALALTCLGPVLPAYVADDGRRLRQVLSAGRRQSVWVAGWMLALAVVYLTAVWLPYGIFGQAYVNGSASSSIVVGGDLMTELLVVWIMIPESLVLAHAYLIERDPGPDVFT